MKNFILTLLCVSFVATSVAQERICHTMENLAYRQSKDPMLKKRMDEIEAFTQKRIAERKNAQHKVNGAIITIPVVVHILYRTSQENISDAQILSQIEVMNEDFRRTNSDRDNVWSQAADTQIEFCLAKVDPNGNPTNGITRKSTSKSSWSANDAIKKSSQGGVNPWDPSKYLNMWVGNLSGGLLGYAQFPGGSAATDGVVMTTTCFGSSKKGSGFYLNAPYDLGRTTTHEVGHYLNLRHIWGDGGCGVDDFVSDTPESDAANNGCNTNHVSCGTKDMVQNYMDYTNDACMNLFTQGQKQRMRAVLEAGGSRRSLALSDKCGGPSQSCTPTTPTGVQVATIKSSTATVSWSSVSGATYDVRYRKAGTSSWSTVSASTNSKELTGLSASTQYQVQVRSKCTNGTSNYSSTTTFTTTEVQITYCESKGNSVSDEYISRVQLGSIDKSSSGASAGYSDYTNISTDVSKASSYTITITPKWTGTVYSEGYSVWIDYNGDGDFTDSGEQVFSKSASKDTPVSGSFTIPNSAKEGKTRMRVVMRYNAIPSSCGAYDYGETEDYSVVIGSTGADTQAPSTPSNLTASNVTETSVTLSWGASSDNVGVTDYDVYQGSTKLGSTASTSANITGLTATTTYSFSVKAKDAAGNESASSNTVTVTTSGGQVSYCESKGNDASYEWIDKVEFGGMSNITGNDGGYKDYTSKVATVGRGTTNKITLSAGFRSSSYNEYWAVYIDFNGDGDFDDAGEKVDEGNSSSADDLTGDIAIPSTAKLGATRMRVSMKYNAAQTPCETFSYGEVEDYTVNITDGSVASLGSTASKGEDLRMRSVSGFGVYPNPSSGVISLRLDRNAKGSYRIINPLGRTVKQGISGSTIDISSLETGMYVIEFNDGQKVLTTKLFKK